MGKFDACKTSWVRDLKKCIPKDNGDFAKLWLNPQIWLLAQNKYLAEDSALVLIDTLLEEEIEYVEKTGAQTNWKI